MPTQYEEDLAYIHHVGFGGFARAAAPAVLSLLQDAGIRTGRIVELGCGGGVLLSALAAAGYQPIGIDSSEAMLRIARVTAPSAMLIRGSLYDVAIPSCGAVIAMGESLNYISAAGAFPPTEPLFCRIADALAPNGFLLFDVIVRGPSAEAPNRSWQAGGDWAVLVDVAPARVPQCITRQITTFRLAGDAYRRSEETHYVHLFAPEELHQQLWRNGFQVQTGHAYGSAVLAPNRLLFCARKSPFGARK
jgi:SAM-dependent methyltransferase